MEHHVNKLQLKNERNPIKGNFKEGLTTWVFILFSFLCLHLAIENYTSYGIIKTPYDLTVDFYLFLRTKGWVFPVIYLGLLFQSLLCYLIEVAIIREWICEKHGLLLHVFNTFFLLNLTAAILLLYDIHSFAAIKFIGMPFFTSYKFWSFAWENKICRENKKQRLNQDQTKDYGSENYQERNITYPQNVTIKNVLLFTICSTSIMYNIQGVKRTKRNFKRLLEMIISSIVIHYVIAFMVHQYIFTELHTMLTNYKQANHLLVLSSAFKLAVPIHILWIIHYFVYCMCYLAHFPSVIWATDQSTIIYKDWWNAENFSVFWSKWNYHIHTWYKKYVFVPVLQMGYSRKFASYAVGFVSGIFHEYLCTATTRTQFGILIVVMISQYPLGTQTQLIHKKVGPRIGNLIVITVLISGHLMNAVLWYYVFYEDI